MMTERAMKDAIVFQTMAADNYNIMVVQRINYMGALLRHRHYADYRSARVLHEAKTDYEIAARAYEHSSYYARYVMGIDE